MKRQARYQKNIIRKLEPGALRGVKKKVENLRQVLKLYEWGW